MAPMLISCVHSNVELKDNTIIIVLGASGDLAKKKTVRNQFPSHSAQFDLQITDD
jgi:glucose-6-phosphate 1-dehydrogenase